jgi:uncharacterized protein
MKRILAIAVCCLAFSIPALAQQPTAAGPDSPATKEDIEAYLQVIHYHDLMANMIDAMAKPMHQMIHQEYLKDQDKLPPGFEEHMEKEMDDMLKNMPFDDMVQAMVPAYEKYLTKGDIQAMVTFYSSPAGQKLLKQMPAIMAEAMQDMMPILTKYMQTVQQHMEQEIQQALQNSPGAPAATPPLTRN